MTKEKICFRCKRKIEPDGDFFAFEEYNKGQFERVDFAHKECWNQFLKKVGDTEEAMSIVRGLKGSLQNIGLLPEEKVIIK